MALRLSFDADTSPVFTSVTVDDGQRAILPTHVTEGGRVLVVLVEPKIVRSQEDLAAILGRKASRR